MRASRWRSSASTCRRSTPVRSPKRCSSAHQRSGVDVSDVVDALCELPQSTSTTASVNSPRSARGSSFPTLRRVLTGLAYVIVLFGAAAAGARLAIEDQLREPRPGWATITLFVVVAIPSAVGLALRTVGDALERDADRIGDGQLWRLVTALVQQDGGVAGMLFNLVALLALGSVAERLLGPGRTIVTFFAIGVLAQLPALAWQPVGAGNSVGNSASPARSPSSSFARDRRDRSRQRRFWRS
jgi:membrane associated rhomboid family serine protease